MAFRRWETPRAKAGGTQKTRAGVIAFTSVGRISPGKITARDAKAAGFPGRSALVAALQGQGEIYKIRLKLAGPDPRVALRKHNKLTGEELAAIAARLARLDRSSTAGAWTMTALRLIAKRLATRAVLLATSIGWQRAPFKLNVRKLKALGLTESLEVGYRLSPRGNVVLKFLEKTPATAQSSRRRP